MLPFRPFYTRVSMCTCLFILFWLNSHVLHVFKRFICKPISIYQVMQLNNPFISAFPLCYPHCTGRPRNDPGLLTQFYKSSVNSLTLYRVFFISFMFKHYPMIQSQVVHRALLISHVRSICK